MVASERDVSQEQARELAEVARLDLSPDRLTTLSWSLRSFLTLADELRAIDAGDSEPAVLMFDDEATA